MSVVDEEIFNDADLETKKEEDQEDVKPQDDVLPGGAPEGHEESAPPPPPLKRAPLPEPEVIGPEEERNLRT